MPKLVRIALAVTFLTSLGALAERSDLQSGRSGDSQCIKSLEELISAFKKRETITGNQTTMMDDWRPIFDIELRYLLDYSMMFFTYQVTFPGNITGYQCPEGASACCTPVNKGGHLPMKTHTVMLFENDLLGILPTPLLVLGTPLNVILAQSFQHIDIGVREYCWSPPTFCKNLFPLFDILRSFSIAVSCYKWVQYHVSSTTDCEKYFSTFDAYTDHERKARVTSD